MSSTELKTVVVVGAGVAGIAVVNGLAKKLPSTHRLVLINEHDFGYWPIASLRGAVIPSWEDKVAVPLGAVFEAGSRHVLLSGTKVLSFTSHSVTVDKVHEGFGTVIPFDFVVIATGKFPFPLTSSL